MRVTHHTKLLLSVLLDAPAKESYGFELSRASGLPSGTLYPILRRLEDEGWLSSRWEEISQEREGRRRRRYYRLTGHGATMARSSVAEQAPGLRLLVPGWARETWQLGTKIHLLGRR
jgi:PadR family transcriptional regulator, regulatory protein PadR